MTYEARGIGEDTSMFTSDDWASFTDEVKLLFDFAKKNGNGMSIILEEKLK